jgi:GntR family transcriptional regulator, rspAB operon transcriptional repressor
MSELELERNVPLSDRAYKLIKKMIIERELAPGDSAPESVLAKRLGISRSPVKWALTRLQEDGLVVGEAWKVLSVAPLDPKYIDNVYQVRKALDVQCVVQSIDKIPSRKIEQLAAQLDAVKPAVEAGKPDAVREVFQFFQLMLLEHCDNELLKVMIGKLQDHLDRIRHASRGMNDYEWLEREYWMLRDELDALRARDAARLASILSNHHEQFRRWISANWD